MSRSPAVAAPLQRLTRCARAATVVFAAVAATGPAGAVTQSWNGYHWARTGNLTIRVGDNVSAAWDPYLNAAISGWSAAKNIDFIHAIGKSAPATCNPVYGGVQACSGNYGATGWLGYATVWTSGGFVVQATVKLNDYYFSQPRYDTAAFRSNVTCQELGHTIGLAHNDTITGNANTGTCMDYSNDPSGKLGTNGTRADTKPGASDFTALNAIYATVNTTQLAYTGAAYRAGDGLDVPGAPDSGYVVAVPEPQTWALFIGGFGMVGGALRMRRPPSALRTVITA